MKVLLTSLAISAVLIVVGILSKDPGVLGNSFLFTTFVIAVPQLLIRYERYRALKEMEERFPDFLRDVIESLRAGMALHRAIQAASRVEYGKLSAEVKKMANQISWGMPVDKALELFGERIKRSRRLRTAIAMIRESYKTGGDMTATLDSVANNCSQLEDADKERRTLLGKYVVVMYFISIMFIAIVVAINYFLVPVFEVPGLPAGQLGLTNPCTKCLEGIGGFECNVCKVYESIAIGLFHAEPVPVVEGQRSCVEAGKRSVCHISSYYASLFFFMSLVQSFFSGLVTGQVSEGSVIAGIKHSLVLLGIAIGTFGILAGTGFLIPVSE
jgi:flagellar protein FlaJ